ncbi:rab GTPase-binding effector protein 2 [Pyxicephalus adspersus]|uniref:rab GTPase-binding effector protein 2 n=1 Tax=Pyxicephalus adspersus TaxID=30357 RepID=UPI003B5C1850
MSRLDDGCGGQDALSSSPDCSSDDPELLVAAETFARGYDCVSISSYPGERLIQGQEDTASLVSTATLVPECIYIPPAGYQLLSDQEIEQQKAALKSTTEHLERVTQEKVTLQEALRCSSEDCANQVKQLMDQIKNSEEILQSLQRSLCDTQQKTAQRMAALTASLGRMCQEVNCLNDENEKLRSLGSEASPIGQGVQLSSQQRTEQHRQERLCIEIVSLQEELRAEQMAKKDLEDQLRRQEETQTEEREIMEATLSSLRTEMERIQQDRKQSELQLQESEIQVQKLWDSLGEQEKLLQKEKEEKVSLEHTLSEERNKVLRLQTELNTSEEVQRDFVRLSQKLQVSLEKIRQATSIKDVQDILEGTRLTDVNQSRIPPIVVITKIGPPNNRSDQASAQETMFGDMGCTQRICLENYSENNQTRSVEADNQFLHFLDVCMREAERVIRQMGSANPYEILVKHIADQVKEELEVERKKMRELQERLKKEEEKPWYKKCTVM